MQNTEIRLKPLADMGGGFAKIGEDTVEINTHGINGALKAWLIGGEAVQIGNLVDGKIKKKADVKEHSGVLITQSGRQMLIGFYKDDNSGRDGLLPFAVKGYEWKKVSGRRFETDSEALKYILSNKTVYESFKRHGHYYIGTGNGVSALAFPCGADEQNPFAFLKNAAAYIGGYRIVCVDEENRRIFSPENSEVI